MSVSQIAPSSVSSSGQRMPSNKLGKQEFLQIFVTQLKNQDPLSPMEADQMATQLAQFSSLEQLVNLNDSIQGMVSAQKETSFMLNANLAQSMIGRTVLASGASLSLSQGQASSEVVFDAASAGSKSTVKILGPGGSVVAVREIGAVTSGRNSVQVDTQGLPAGNYTYQVEVTNAEGNPVSTAAYTRVRVDSIQFGAQGVTLIAGGRTIPLDDVVEISL